MSSVSGCIWELCASEKWQRREVGEVKMRNVLLRLFVHSYVFFLEEWISCLVSILVMNFCIKDWFLECIVLHFFHSEEKGGAIPSQSILSIWMYLLYFNFSFCICKISVHLFHLPLGTEAYCKTCLEKNMHVYVVYFSSLSFLPSHLNIFLLYKYIYIYIFSLVTKILWQQFLIFPGKLQ